MSRIACALALFVSGCTVLPAADSAPRVQRHRYSETPQRPLELVFHVPSAVRPEERRPAILFFFGGGFWTWNVEQFAQQADYFARRGAVAVLVDYRTGEKDGTKPPAAFEDARRAMRWVRQNAARLGIDPARIAASGGSAGGSLAASLIVADGLDAADADRSVSVRPDALLLYNPGLSARASERTSQRFGDEATWRKTAALLHVGPGTPPTLLLYGSQDNLLASGRAFADKLREHGVRVALEVTEGVGHGFFNFAPHLANSTQQVDSFLQSLGWLEAEPQVPLPSAAAKLSESPNNPERGK
jgi:acetyl esterase/lipase